MAILCPEDNRYFVDDLFDRCNPNWVSRETDSSRLNQFSISKDYNQEDYLIEAKEYENNKLYLPAAHNYRQGGSEEDALRCESLALLNKYEVHGESFFQESIESCFVTFKALKNKDEFNKENIAVMEIWDLFSPLIRKLDDEKSLEAAMVFATQLDDSQSINAAMAKDAIQSGNYKKAIKLFIEIEDYNSAKEFIEHNSISFKERIQF